MGEILNFDGMPKFLTVDWNCGDSILAACFLAPGNGIIDLGEEQFEKEASVAMEAEFMTSFPNPKLTRDFFRLARDHGGFDWTLEGHQAETGNSLDSTRSSQAKRCDKQ
ncbi:hypothetical protein ROA7450_01517 [Roseovarius albus]|uniref:Uncharacterized protein n=1 Tax=Roseovarius albus TaxID=1247867 RepID=A0A1X6YWZ4_9RHOB|nr:hypothetical protein [Roseovarius albus]SLN34161.1 hypothetical protein ROA7450_01517 [Roseovarius albus]